MSVAIEVDDALYAALEVYARTVGESPETMVQQLLRKQLFNSETCRSQVFERNLEAFYTLLPELLQHYEGQFVALYNGEVIGFGTDRLTLAKEMYTRYERSAILVKAVSRTLRVRNLPYRQLRRPH